MIALPPAPIRRKGAFTVKPDLILCSKGYYFKSFSSKPADTEDLEPLLELLLGARAVRRLELLHG